MVERFDYDPYGKFTTLTSSWLTTSEVYGWSSFFQGGRYDPITGLYNFRYRDYSPTLGRWMEEDPAGYVDGANVYQFVSSSPLSLIDPFGLTGGDEDGELERDQLEEEQREWDDILRRREEWEAMHEETPAERADREGREEFFRRQAESSEKAAQKHEDDLQKEAQDRDVPLRRLRDLDNLKNGRFPSPAEQRLQDDLDDLLDAVRQGKIGEKDALDRADDLLRNSDATRSRCPEQGNYRGRYNAARGALGRSRLSKDYDAHHRIPQMYRNHRDFRDRDLDAPSNIEGLPGPNSARGNVHSRMTADWMEFDRTHPNASGSEILDFANQMDAKYKEYIWQ